MKRIVGAALALAACDRAPAPGEPARAAQAGPALERAAIAAGIVADSARVDPVGAYGGITDRVCVVRRGGALRVGAAIDYGAGQRCLARGSATGSTRLGIDFGADCRIEARFDGETIRFPAIVPAGCDARCTGRATLGALTADRLSGATTEAAAMRTADGQLLCG